MVFYYTIFASIYCNIFEKSAIVNDFIEIRIQMYEISKREQSIHNTINLGHHRFTFFITRCRNFYKFK